MAKFMPLWLPLSHGNSSIRPDRYYEPEPPDVHGLATANLKGILREVEAVLAIIAYWTDTPEEIPSDRRTDTCRREEKYSDLIIHFTKLGQE